MNSTEKKVATITFHRAINCGAILQAYALQQAIFHFDVKTDIIDYRCPCLEKTYHLIHTPYNCKGFISDILHFPTQSIKKFKFRQFLKNNMKITQPCYTLLDLINISSNYSMVITGSDQVWNLQLTESDKAYFLTFLERNKRASYAASVGKKNLYSDYGKNFCNELKQFEFLSVREENTATSLERVIGKKPQVVVDPVFLLTAEEWNAITLQNKNGTPYIFVYCLNEQLVYEEANRIAKETGLAIVCVPSGWKCPIKGQIKRSMGPGEFVTAIRYAEYVVTDSFHASAFSLIYQRKLVPVLRNNQIGLNERLVSLMNMCGLKNIFTDKEKIYETVSYSKIEERLMEHIKKSKYYLEEIVKRGIDDEN